MFLLHKSSVGQIILGLLRIPVSLPHSQKLSLDPTMDQACINFTRYHTIGGLGQRSLYSDSLRSVARIPVESQIFRIRPGPALGPNQPPVQCVPDLFPRCKEAGAWR